jgi:hypothetical protein
MKQFFAITFVFFFGCIFQSASAGVLSDMERALMPGELSAPHEEFVKECTVCHKLFGQEEQNKLCMDCHDHKNIAEDPLCCLTNKHLIIDSLILNFRAGTRMPPVKNATNQKSNTMRRLGSV